MIVERRTELLLTPFAIARRLSEREAPVLFFADGGRRAYLACDPLESSRELDPEPALALRRGGARVPRWFGLVPYESLRDAERSARADERPPATIAQPLWRRYGAWVEVAPGSTVVLGDDESRVRALLELLRRPAPESSAETRLEWLEAPEEGELHAARVRRALEYIAQGEIYEVNLARRLRFRARGSTFDLLERIAAAGSPAYATALEWPELGVVSASPELCLESAPDGRVWTSPIKGTRPRAADTERDRALARELDQDPKEIAELTMIIDVERNDLGRLAVPGSVRVSEPPRVESHPSVHHRVATIEARCRDEVTRRDLLAAMLPSGSVTGAPKLRAMEIIAELEPVRRGLYTGAFGVIRQDGSLELGMAIRTLTLRDGLGEYFTGGGIVADSVPEREVEETLWKAADFVTLVGRPAGC